MSQFTQQLNKKIENFLHVTKDASKHIEEVETQFTQVSSKFTELSNEMKTEL